MPDKSEHPQGEPKKERSDLQKATLGTQYRQEDPRIVLRNKGIEGLQRDAGYIPPKIPDIDLFNIETLEKKREPRVIFEEVEKAFPSLTAFIEETDPTRLEKILEERREQSQQLAERILPFLVQAEVNYLYSLLFAPVEFPSEDIIKNEGSKILEFRERKMMELNPSSPDLKLLDFPPDIFYVPIYPISSDYPGQKINEDRKSYEYSLNERYTQLFVLTVYGRLLAQTTETKRQFSNFRHYLKGHFMDLYKGEFSYMDVSSKRTNLTPLQLLAQKQFNRLQKIINCQFVSNSLDFPRHLTTKWDTSDNFSSKDLRAINFQSVDANFLEIHGSNLENTNFKDAFLDEFSAKGCNFNNVIFLNSSMKKTIFESCDLNDADMRVDDEVTYMQRANLLKIKKCNANGLKLSGRDVIQLDLTESDLLGGDVDGLTVEYLILKGTDLRGVKGMPDSSCPAQIVYPDTILPNGKRPAETMEMTVEEIFTLKSDS